MTCDLITIYCNLLQLTSNILTYILQRFGDNSRFFLKVCDQIHTNLISFTREKFSICNYDCHLKPFPPILSRDFLNILFSLHIMYCNIAIKQEKQTDMAL